MSKFRVRSVRYCLEIIFSVTLMLTCVYNYINAPYVACKLVKCDDKVAITVVKAVFPYRYQAFTCLVCTIAIVYKSITIFPKYMKKIESYELYFPANKSMKSVHFLFNVTVLFTYVIITLPVNGLRIYLIYFNLNDDVGQTLIFIVQLYVQNWSLCVTEMYFIVRCFGLYQKFRSINKEMATFKSEIISFNSYPAILQPEGTDGRIFGGSEVTDRSTSSRINMDKLANSIELLRMRHQFLRDIFASLNDLYGIQIGMSVCLLFMLVLFDLYGESFTKHNKTRSKTLIYGWMLQHFVRFCSIIMIAHITTKQVSLYLLIHCNFIVQILNKSKSIILITE